MMPSVGTEIIGSTKYQLTDASSCVVRKSADGKCILRLDCANTGINAEKLVCGNYISAQTSRADPTEFEFKIAKVTQNLNGIISVEAYQLTYWLSRYPVKAFEKAKRTPSEAIDALYANCVKSPSGDGLRLMASDTAGAQEFGFDRPTNLREAVYGNGGLIDTYGGYAKGIVNTLAWHKADALGENKGTIRYGINLTKYKRTVDVSDTYSHAYVFWDGNVDIFDEKGNKTGSEDRHVEIPGLLQLSGNTTFNGATVMDLSKEFDAPPSVDQMTQKARDIAAQREIPYPEISLDIAFVPLRLTDDFKNLSFLEEIDLFDTVSVEVPMYGTTTAMVTETEYNVLNETYNRVLIGSARGGIGNLIARLF